jgi:hypothetical protein
MSLPYFLGYAFELPPSNWERPLAGGLPLYFLSELEGSQITSFPLPSQTLIAN